MLHWHMDLVSLADEVGIGRTGPAAERGPGSIAVAGLPTSASSELGSVGEAQGSVLKEYVVDR